METQLFFEKIRSYHDISTAAEQAWKNLLRIREYGKNEHFISAGAYPKKVGFVVHGLLSQNFTTEDGNVVIKYFFPEQRMAASMGAMLSGTASTFDIVAIEETTLVEYDFTEFRKLFAAFPDLALFYIAYNDRHWIVEKEPLEVDWRATTAAQRYDELLAKYPNIVKRIKKHHIASYLGITPTQLSRIFFANK